MGLTASLIRIVAHLEPNSPELERAFESLPGGPVAISAEGDTWQYLGTAQTETGEVTHTFRHRLHPFTNARMYENVPALPTWLPQERERVAA
jgi:hypothetical protein